MGKKQAFTLIELLVVIAVIAVLFGILMPALNRAKESGKRTVCMSNLKNLTYAWSMYADDYRDRLVSGIMGRENNNAPMWCGNTYSQTGTQAGAQILTEAQQQDAIRRGALFSYVKTFAAYRCPTGVRGECDSYTVIDGMNGEGDDLNKSQIPSKGLIYSSKNDIKQPSLRIVFLDEGYVTPSSFAVRYNKEYWYDIPSIRHGNGCTFSFADAHIDYYKWTGQIAIQLGKTRDLGLSQGGAWAATQQNSTPLSLEDQKDLQFVQKGCFGKFNYTQLF